MGIRNIFNTAISKIFDNLVGQIIGLILSSAIIVTVIVKFKDLLLQSVSIKIWFIVFFVLVFTFLLFYFIRQKSKKKEYYIPTRRTLHEGIENSDYSRRTKWNYKNYNSFYFIPLISYSRDSAEFITFCGPFCTKCDHFLHINELTTKPEFFCVNCAKKYKVPIELIGDYEEKLFAYFKEEYRKGRLKDSAA